MLAWDGIPDDSQGSVSSLWVRGFWFWGLSAHFELVFVVSAVCEKMKARKSRQNYLQGSFSPSGFILFEFVARALVLDWSLACRQRAKKWMLKKLARKTRKGRFPPWVHIIALAWSAENIGKNKNFAKTWKVARKIRKGRFSTSAFIVLLFYLLSAQKIEKHIFWNQ